MEEDQNETEPPNTDPVLPEADNSGSEKWQMFFFLRGKLANVEHNKTKFLKTSSNSDRFSYASSNSGSEDPRMLLEGEPSG